MTEATNIDDILDGTLDDLDDLPSFKPFTPGLHLCKVKITQKEVTKFPVMEVELTAKETIELADTSAEPVKAGDVASTIFFMKHSNPKTAELGQGKFKELMKGLAPSFPDAKKLSELIAAVNDTDEVIVATSVRKTKDDKEYLDIQTMSMP